MTPPPAAAGEPAPLETTTYRRLLADEGAGPVVTAVEAGAAPVLLMVDRAGTILDAAPTSAPLLGTTEAVGQALTTFVAEDEHDALHAMIACALDDDARAARAYEAVLTGRRADGLPLVMRASAPGGMDTSTAAIVLERWGGPVTRAGDPGFSAPPRSGPDHLLSHDARGAVRNARNFSGIFARKVRTAGPDGGPPLDAQGAPITFDLLDTALRSVGNADEMLEQIVWFIRLEHEPLALQPLPLAEVVEAAQQKATTTGEELAEAHDDPELAGPTTVHVDPSAAAVELLVHLDLVAWCFAELITNARKFAGPSTVVTVRAQAAGAWVHVEVESTGKAVEPDLAEDAFRLGRMLQPRGDRPGVGMGLPLVRRIVTRHAGRVAIAPSAAGSPEATTVRLRLPGVVPENLV